MAVSASRLATALRAKLLTVTGFQDNAATTAFATAIAEAVLDELTGHAVVTVAAGIDVATTGTASAQAGATTEPGTGTIS